MRGQTSDDFTEFFRVHYDRIRAVAERRLDCAEDADDVAASAFRLAWERHRSGGSLDAPWIYIVVRNLVGDEYRRRNRQRALQARAAEVLACSSSDEETDLPDVLSGIAERHRDVLWLTYGEQMTAQEIADLRGVSLSTTRVRLHRARCALRNAVEGVRAERELRERKPRGR